MITEECNTKKKCLFYVSQYHLEMILLPYIKSNMDKLKFIIFTETDLEKTINILLTKVNLKEDTKEEIKSLRWNSEDKMYLLKEAIDRKEKIEIIINGSKDYIKKMHENIRIITNEEINFIDCYNLEDKKVDMKEIISQYEFVLNTQKIL